MLLVQMLLHNYSCSLALYIIFLCILLNIQHIKKNFRQSCGLQQVLYFTLSAYFLCGVSFQKKLINFDLSLLQGMVYS